MTDPVFSRREAVTFTPDGSPRTYNIVPLTFRERQAFRAELAREGGLYPPRVQLIAALRSAVQEIAPDNAPGLLADIDAAEATPDDTGAQTRLASIEAIAAEVPIYAALLAARERYLGTLPWVAARHALRGWDGPDLPPFRRERGAVPADLLDTLPDAEIEAIGWRASVDATERECGGKLRGALAVARDPGAYDGGLTPDDGGEWLVAGEPVASNPRLSTAPPWHDFIRLWAACRAGMGGMAHWPDPGGVGDQAAWIIDAFAMLAAIDAKLDDAARRGGRGQVV